MEAILDGIGAVLGVVLFFAFMAGFLIFVQVGVSKLFNVRVHSRSGQKISEPDDWDELMDRIKELTGKETVSEKLYGDADVKKELKELRERRDKEEISRAKYGRLARKILLLRLDALKSEGTISESELNHGRRRVMKGMEVAPPKTDYP